MDTERCGLENVDGLLCVLIKGHEGEHCFRKVPILPGSTMFGGTHLYSAFCPFCGSRPLVEGPGCKRCGSNELEESDKPEEVE
jgi:hypothetical protein